MAFGFDISRRPGFQGKQTSLGPLEPVAVRSVLAPEVRASPAMIPDLTQMPQLPGRQTFKEYWGTKDSSGMTRADRLGEIGGLLRDREEHFIPAPRVDLPEPTQTSLPGRLSLQPSGDVLNSVRRRYGL